MFQYSIEKNVKRENSIVYNRLNIYGMIHLCDYSDLYLASFHNGGMIVIINVGEYKHKNEMEYYIDLAFIMKVKNGERYIIPIGERNTLAL